MFHQNVNSLQNKSEEIAMLMSDLKAQVVFLTETKIDKSYPNSQFSVEGYSMYWKDRKKGGGGIRAYITSSLPSKQLKLPKSYSAIEALAIESTFGKHKIAVLGLYRSPKASGTNYHTKLEDELHEVVSWLSLQK